MAKRGPKPTQILWDDFDKLCGIQCTLREIAGWFCVSEDTIENVVKRDKGMKFSEYYEQKRGPGKISIRRKQYEIAMKGNVGMLIWLGKQYLDQSEKVDQNINSDRPLDVTINLSGGHVPQGGSKPPGSDSTPA